MTYLIDMENTENYMEIQLPKNLKLIIFNLQILLTWSLCLCFTG